MAHYKPIDTSPRFLAVDLERQLLPGRFEYALNHLIDRELDLSGFDARYRNDLTGAAYPPGMLLKVVLFAYSQGIVSSRGIERACREHITLIALSGDSAPHYTTLAAFISGLGDDIGMRPRDERFKDQDQYKALPDPLYDKAHPKKGARHYRPRDFDHDPEAGTCLCPAGKQLYQNGSNCQHNGLIGTKLQGALRDCVPCHLREKCLRTPEKTKTRQVMFFRGRIGNGTDSPSGRMKRAIDSERGRELYGGRFATVEPVFGNLRHNKRLNRFTLRGRKKVDGQWKLFCLVHHIEKLAHHGYGQ